MIMNYKVVKLHFSTAVHFGDGGLMTCKNTFSADTLFSALCIEALRKTDDSFSCLLDASKERKLVFSDAFPFISDELYVPKPLMEVHKEINETENVGNSILKKAAKKLSYLPVSELDNYLSGNADVVELGSFFSDNFGRFDLVMKNRVIENEDTLPFSVKIFRFYEASGLYFVVGFEEESSIKLIEDLLNSLSNTGIGGKISSGYGKFKFEIIDSEIINSRIGKASSKYLLLTTSLPSNDELDVIDSANYLLTKKSGFVSSDTYADTNRKKHDMYLVTAGSVFERKYHGDIYDVSTSEGSHSVYRYSVPVFIGV